jgi:hypothetical protein
VVPAYLPEVYMPLLENCGYLTATVDKTLQSVYCFAFVTFRLRHHYTPGSNAGQETGINTLTVRFTVLRLIRSYKNHVFPAVFLCKWISI